MRKRIVLILFVALATVGFYAGRNFLPGVFGYGVGQTAVKRSDAAPKTSDTGSDTADSGIPQTGGSPTGTPKGGASPSGEGETQPPAKDTYWIDVDISEQEVNIMQGEEVLWTMTASTGVEGKETPLGDFQIQNRGEWFFSEKYQQGAKYWVSFKDWGIYLFHSLAMDKNQNIIPEEAEKLGSPASHGCIRLAIDDAKWIYDNIPERAKVSIHE